MVRFLAALSLFLTALTFGQSQSDPGLRPYVELWRRDQADSVQMALPALQKKFPGKPETRFFEAVFTGDGEDAMRKFTALIKDHPGFIFAAESRYRIVQYEVARGHYTVARAQADELKRQFANTPWPAKAEFYFSSMAGDTVAIIPKPAEVKKAPEPEGRFALQVGAFAEIKNARELQERLLKKGYDPVELTEKAVNGKTLTVVRLGAYATKDEAQEAAEAIKSKENLTCAVVEK